MYQYSEYIHSDVTMGTKDVFHIIKSKTAVILSLQIM